jgi:hypothetical protein
MKKNIKVRLNGTKLFVLRSDLVYLFRMLIDASGQPVHVIFIENPIRIFLRFGELQEIFQFIVSELDTHGGHQGANPIAIYITSAQLVKFLETQQ